MGQSLIRNETCRIKLNIFTGSSSLNSGMTIPKSLKRVTKSGSSCPENVSIMCINKIVSILKLVVSHAISL